jgi:hypothetical protein
MRLMISGLFTLILASPAAGACRDVWDCSRGPCRQVQVCDSPFDKPLPPPVAIPPTPLPPPNNLFLPPALPPLGATSCHQVYLCDNFGRCSWQNVCQ